IALSYLPTEEEDAQHVNSVIEQSGRKAVLLPGDLAEPDFCRQVVEDAALELGGLDALVNNAGRQIAIEQFEDLSDEQWTHTFEVNIHAIYRISKAALAHLPAGATIVTSSSIQAYEPSPTLVDSASTRPAINSSPRGVASSSHHAGSGSTPSPPVRSGRPCRSPTASPKAPCPSSGSPRRWDEPASRRSWHRHMCS